MRLCLSTPRRPHGLSGVDENFLAQIASGPGYNYFATTSADLKKLFHRRSQPLSRSAWFSNVVIDEELFLSQGMGGGNLGVTGREIFNR